MFLGACICSISQGKNACICSLSQETIVHCEMGSIAALQGSTVTFRTTNSTGRRKQFQPVGPVSSITALVSYGLHAWTTVYCKQLLPWTACFPGYLRLFIFAAWPAVCFAKAILQPLAQDAHGAYLLGTGFMPALLILVGSL
jgi:hypothetical protein